MSEQEAFEKWALANKVNTQTFGDVLPYNYENPKNRGGYFWSDGDAAWGAWSACAAAKDAKIAELRQQRNEASALQLRAIHERDVTNRLLGELLAVIHCDGGHYQAEHGAAKAVQDGIKAVSELREKLAASEASDGESIAMYRKVRDERDEAREEAAANAACARRLYGICDLSQKFVATFAGAMPVTRRSNYSRDLLAQIDGALAATPEHLR